eukprot:364248-Chlamydomonas_euryale.AAC.1
MAYFRPAASASLLGRPLATFLLVPASPYCFVLAPTRSSSHLPVPASPCCFLLAPTGSYLLVPSLRPGPSAQSERRRLRQRAHRGLHGTENCGRARRAAARRLPGQPVAKLV